MPKPNYAFEKRQRELAKKKKKEEKLEEKAQRKAAQERGELPADTDASGTEAPGTPTADSSKPAG